MWTQLIGSDEKNTMPFQPAGPLGVRAAGLWRSADQHFKNLSLVNRMGEVSLHNAPV